MVGSGPTATQSSDRSVLLRVVNYRHTVVCRCGLIKLSVASEIIEARMTVGAEYREQVAPELKRFAADSDLTAEQKEKLQAAPL